MSNNEILDNIFNNVSRKMIDEYVKEISISYKNNRYHYSNNLDIEHLDNYLHKDWLLKFGKSLGYQKIIFKPNAIGQSICIMKKPYKITQI